MGRKLGPGSGDTPDCLTGFVPTSRLATCYQKLAAGRCRKDLILTHVLACGFVPLVQQETFDCRKSPFGSPVTFPSSGDCGKRTFRTCLRRRRVKAALSVSGTRAKVVWSLGSNRERRRNRSDFAYGPKKDTTLKAKSISNEYRDGRRSIFA